MSNLNRQVAEALGYQVVGEIGYIGQIWIDKGYTPERGVTLETGKWMPDYQNDLNAAIHALKELQKNFVLSYDYNRELWSLSIDGTSLFYGNTPNPALMICEQILYFVGLENTP